MMETKAELALLRNASWNITPCGDDDILHTLMLADDERITVLDRLTGYSGGRRDIESGYIDKDGKFWLASGQFDIRAFDDLSVADAIDKIKVNANTCRGI